MNYLLGGDGSIGDAMEGKLCLVGGTGGTGGAVGDAPRSALTLDNMEGGSCLLEVMHHVVLCSLRPRSGFCLLEVLEMPEIIRSCRR